MRHPKGVHQTEARLKFLKAYRDMQSAAELLTALKNVAWFSKCGEPMDADRFQVKSLEEAKECYSGKAGVRWENFKNSICNRMVGLLWEETHHCRDEQQQRAKEIHTAIELFLKENHRRIHFALHEDPALERMIRLDLNAIATEVEFARYEKIHFFSKMLLPIYLAGHLPCGWHGKPMAQRWSGNSLVDLPEGKIVIY